MAVVRSFGGAETARKHDDGDYGSYIAVDSRLSYIHPSHFGAL